MKQLVVSADSRETRVAILEQGRLVEFYVERRSRRSLVGNIYKGRVENVLAGMDAAFIDVGLEKNGFLYVDEVFLPDQADTRGKKITQLLKAGQELVCDAQAHVVRAEGIAADHRVEYRRKVSGLRAGRQHVRRLAASAGRGASAYAQALPRTEAGRCGGDHQDGRGGCHREGHHP